MIIKGDLVRVDTLRKKVHVILGDRPQLGWGYLVELFCGVSVHPDKILSGVPSLEDLAGADGCDICAARLAAFTSRPSDDLEKSVLACLVDTFGEGVSADLLPKVMMVLDGTGPELWLFHVEGPAGVKQGQRILPDSALRLALVYQAFKTLGINTAEPGQDFSIQLRRVE